MSTVAGITKQASAAGWRREAVLAALALVVAAGCSEGSAVTTTTAPAATTLPATTAPSTTTSTTTTAPTNATWDVVALGDSYVAGAGVGCPPWGFTGAYADALGEELGIETVLHAYAEYGTVAEVNQRLAASDDMQQTIATAEVVIVWLGYHNVLGALWGETCGTGWPEPLRTCLIEATATMPADFDELLGTIESLVTDEAIVMIGTQALGPPEIEKWGDEPFWPELRGVAYDGWAEGIALAAAAHGAILVNTAAWFTGPEGNQLLRREFLLPDGIHFSRPGHTALAQLFLAADGLE